MLRLDNVTKRYGPRAVLAGVSLVLNRGETAGLIGPNGSGKSTLLRIAAAELPPDGGRVEVAPGARVAYLAQSIEPGPGETAGDRFPALFPAAAEASLAVLAARLAEARDEPDAALQRRYEALLAALEGPSLGIEAARALGVGAVEGSAPLARLSGGEQAKLGLASALSARADVLLLDEPTNHMDLAGIEWLEDRLAAFDGATLLVSHDRALLDAVVDGLVALDLYGHAEGFAGGYSEWAEERERRLRDQWERYGRQQRQERRLRRSLSAIESRSRYIENSTIDFAIRKKAKKIARRSTTLKARLERQAAFAERVQRPGDRPHGIQVTFAGTVHAASRLLELHDARVTPGGAPDGRVLLEGLDLAVDRGRRVALIGANGSGKSTLLRTLSGALPLAGGSRSVAGSAQVGYLAQDDAGEGAPDDTPLAVARRAAGISEVDAANFLHRVLLGRQQVTTPLARLSYGERRRLALALLMLRGCNLLLLDEPTNHLDLPSREAVEAALDGFEGAAVVVTHDRYLVRRFADEVWSIEDGRLRVRSPEALV